MLLVGSESLQQRQRRRGAGHEAAATESPYLSESYFLFLLLLQLIAGREQRQRWQQQHDAASSEAACKIGPTVADRSDDPQRQRRFQRHRLEIRAVLRQRRLLREQIYRRWIIFRSEWWLRLSYIDLPLAPPYLERHFSRQEVILLPQLYSNQFLFLFLHRLKFKVPTLILVAE